MKALKLIFPFYVLLFLFSCGSVKKTEEILPNWVQQKPIDHEYFYGVGKSSKFGDATRYIAKARGEALSDLAQEVSINISSKSVLYKFENEAGISEYYQDRIKTNSKEYLEGFTPISFYENENSYWTLYQIKKATYYQIKEQRKQKAFSEAYQLLLEGQNLEKQFSYKNALKKYILTLERIKHYLGEDTSFEVGNKSINISKETMLSLQKCMDQLKIDTPKKEILKNRGETMLLDKSVLSFSNTENLFLAEYPILLNSKALEIYNLSRRTNKNGALDFEFNLNSSREKETLNASLNWRRIYNTTTNDLLIRKILSTIIPPKAHISIAISQPKITIKPHQLNNLGYLIKENIVSYFQKKKITEVANSKTKNTYIITYSIEEKKSNSTIIFELSYTVKIKNNTILKSVFSKNFEKNMYGNSTRQDLWKKVKNEFERKHLNAIYKKITQQL